MKTLWTGVGLIIAMLFLLGILITEAWASEDCMTPADIHRGLVKGNPRYTIESETLELTGPAREKFAINTKHPNPSYSAKTVIYAITGLSGAAGFAVDFDAGNCNIRSDGTRVTASDNEVYGFGPAPMGLILRAAGLEGD